VHSAHARDLETYISAGMQPEHMRDAVFVGVGGVGIGTSLHELAADKTIGEIAPAKVVNVLEIQKKAAGSVAGRAARSLALMDWESAQRHPLPALKVTRHRLFEKLSEYLKALDKEYPNVPAGKDPSGKDPYTDTFDEKTFQPHLAADLEKLLDEVNKARATPASVLPELVRAGETRTRAFNGRADGFPRRRESRQEITQTAKVDTLGPIGELAERILQAHKADPDSSDLTKESIEAIKGLLDNGDREGLSRLLQI
jgi:hypothetical protein